MRWRLSDYGSVGYSVGRPTGETRDEQDSDTVLEGAVLAQGGVALTYVHLLHGGNGSIERVKNGVM